MMLRRRYCAPEVSSAASSVKPARARPLRALSACWLQGRSVGGIHRKKSLPGSGVAIRRTLGPSRHRWEHRGPELASNLARGGRSIYTGSHNRRVKMEIPDKPDVADSTQAGPYNAQ